MSRRTGIGQARRGPGAVANRPKDGTLAQGRNYDRVRLADLPEPEDVGDVDGPLDDAERELAAVCDKAIDDWDESTIVLAKALANYRGRRLYRDTHGTYDEWCQWRFGKTRYWALRLEDSYEITRALLPAGNTDSRPALLPAGNTTGTEVEVEVLMPTQHTRVLKKARLDGGDDEMRAVYEETAASGKVTGERLEETRRQRRNAGSGGPVEVVDAELVDDEDSRSIDDMLAPSAQMLQHLRSAWKLWEPAMEGLDEAGTAAIPRRQDIGRILRSFARANEKDNA